MHDPSFSHGRPFLSCRPQPFGRFSSSLTTRGPCGPGGRSVPRSPAQARDLNGRILGPTCGYVAFTGQRRTKLHGTFLSEGGITRLIGAVLLEQNDEWQFQHRYMQVEGMLELATPEIEELTTPVPTLPPRSR